MSRNLKLIFAAAIISLVLPSLASAVSLGEKADFFIDPTFDSFQREEISTTLQKIGLGLYFYVDDNWWNSLNYQKKREIEQAFHFLDSEFYHKIYPSLTSVYGSEWNPGIDDKSYITVLIHPMADNVGGYFRNTDEYLRLQAPDSNEREMIYLNAEIIENPLAKSFLAHEFTHLITFNQKDRKQDKTEEIWLNEARAEYAPTLVGYDQEYEGSNLHARVEEFLKNPTDSLTGWQAKSSDYGALNLFIQYLVDHYGIEILADSMASKEIGIQSINQALEQNGFKKDFAQIFTDWTIAVLVNDCSLGKEYCYKNKNLKDLRVSPLINFLPLTGESSLKYSNSTQDWAGNWLKIIGGRGKTLKFEFNGSSQIEFKIPYILEDSKGDLEIYFLGLDSGQNGKIYISDFGKETVSLTVIPSIQSKISGFDSAEPYYSFFWKASTQSNTVAVQEQLKQELLVQIAVLMQRIDEVKAQIEAILAERAGEISCQSFETDLCLGMKNNEVKCLQEFLKSQNQEIYPEALITGYFGPLTQMAVKRYQDSKGVIITGYFGPLTRAAANNK